MSHVPWNSETVNSLFDYLDANSDQFANSDARNKVGFPESAKFISRKFSIDPPFSAQQVKKKFSNLWNKYKKAGFTSEQLFKEGRSCLNLPTRFAADSPDTTSSALKGDHSEPDPEEPRNLEAEPTVVRRGQRRTEPEKTSKSDECAALRKEIEKLRTHLASESRTERGPQDLLSQIMRLEPSDQSIRLAMDDMVKIIRGIVHSYQDEGFGQMIPEMSIIEKKFPGLCSLCEQALQVQPQESLFRYTASLSLKVGPPDNAELLRSLIGAAIHNWALESEFPEFSGGNDPVLRQSYRLVRKNYGLIAEMHHRQALTKSFIDEEHFQRKNLPIKAEELAINLAGALSRSLAPDGNFKKVVYPSHWIDYEPKIRTLFEKALSLCCKLKLCVSDSHCFFWPAPGTKFNVETMTTGQDEENFPEVRVRLTLFPGLAASSNEDFTSEESDDARLLRGLRQSKDGEVIVRALVLV
ncbi:hypothetical protein PV08_02342 [Exophiala spinifera]|uniref:Uncharacterized protein n=1 Tax=Exophiala spinifera TaxID=91928 RepID=A0A0D2BHI4_9EURO|nr:uncharacterized protein PV08_02342 [Exophiala spinifera]KIW18055.1 hypothetical protein PV08_02342 [Exophiala spinifera]